MPYSLLSDRPTLRPIISRHVARNRITLYDDNDDYIYVNAAELREANRNSPPAAISQEPAQPHMDVDGGEDQLDWLPRTEVWNRHAITPPIPPSPPQPSYSRATSSSFISRSPERYREYPSGYGTTQPLYSTLLQSFYQQRAQQHRQQQQQQQSGNLPFYIFYKCLYAKPNNNLHPKQDLVVTKHHLVEVHHLLVGMMVNTFP